MHSREKRSELLPRHAERAGWSGSTVQRVGADDPALIERGRSGEQATVGDRKLRECAQLSCADRNGKR